MIICQDSNASEMIGDCKTIGSDWLKLMHSEYQLLRQRSHLPACQTRSLQWVMSCMLTSVQLYFVWHVCVQLRTEGYRVVFWQSDRNQGLSHFTLKHVSMKD